VNGNFCFSFFIRFNCIKIFLELYIFIFSNFIIVSYHIIQLTAEQFIQFIGFLISQGFARTRNRYFRLVTICSSFSLNLYVISGNDFITPCIFCCKSISSILLQSLQFCISYSFCKSESQIINAFVSSRFFFWVCYTSQSIYTKIICNISYNKASITFRICQTDFVSLNICSFQIHRINQSVNLTTTSGNK